MEQTPLGYPDLAAAALIGCLVTAVATPLLVWVARRLGALDRPAGYKAHQVATPLLGGIGIAAGTAFSVVWVLPESSREHVAGLSALAVGSLIIVMAGLLDDLRGLSPTRKFLWQLGAATAAGLCLALLGVRLNLFLQ